ncbi:MAG: hypothetical protein JO345_06215 [Streptosporangiaceae bacterium]|nr:hypothetical protein [Streptosporangiaceae bacterium]
MIICRKCGFRNVDADAFCGACGSFLEFTGEKITPKVSEEFRQRAEEEAAAPTPKRSLLDRIERTVMSVIAFTPEEAAVPKPREGGDDTSGDPVTADSPAGSPADPSEPGDPVTAASSPPSAGDLVAPVEAPSGGQPPDAEAKPPERTPQATRQLAVAVTKAKPTRRLRPGDLICGQCGEGNPPVRKFCSRCGSSLLQAEQVRTPWWRRIVRRGPRLIEMPTEDAAAGTGTDTGSRRSGAHDSQLRKALTGRDPRYALRKIYRRARLILAAVIAIGVILYGSYGPFRYLIDSRVDSAKNKVTGAIDIHYVPVHAVAVSANLQDKRNPGYDAVDGYLNTYWLASYSTADYPTLTLTFGAPVTLGRMIIYSGASGDYLAHGRPSLLVLVFSNDKSDTLIPQDTPKEQVLDIRYAAQVTSVKIQLEGTYPGTDRPADVAISDIELFKLE